MKIKLILFLFLSLFQIIKPAALPGKEKLEANFFQDLKIGDLGSCFSLINSINIDCVDVSGRTALFPAVSSENLDIVNMVLKEIDARAKKVNVATQSKAKTNALHLAAIQGHEHIVRILVNAAEKLYDSKKIDAVNAKGSGGLTPLQFALRSRNFDAAEIFAKSKLTKIGQNIDQHDDNLKNALFYAIEAKNVKFVQLLLDLNADPNKLYVHDLRLHDKDYHTQKILELLLAKGYVAKQKNNVNSDDDEEETQEKIINIILNLLKLRFATKEECLREAKTALMGYNEIRCDLIMLNLHKAFPDIKLIDLKSMAIEGIDEALQAMAKGKKAPSDVPTDEITSFYMEDFEALRNLHPEKTTEEIIKLCKI